MVTKNWKAIGLLAEGRSLFSTCLQSDLTEKTVRKYIRSKNLPSEMSASRTWWTHADPFGTVLEEACMMLTENPGLQANAVFDWLTWEGRGV